MFDSHQTIEIKPKKRLKQAWPMLGVTIFALSGLLWCELYVRGQSSAPAPIIATINPDEGLGRDDLIWEEVDQSQAISKQFQQAQHHSKLGESTEAIGLYKLILEANPNHQMAGINLALLQQKTNDWETSLSTLKHVLKVAGGSRKGKVYALLGRGFEHLGQYDQAVNHYESSIKYRPAHSLTWMRLAQASALAGQTYQSVLALYEKVIALSSQAPDAYLQKGRYQLERLDFDGAADTFERTDKLLLSDQQSLMKESLLLIAYLERGRFTKIRKRLLKQEGAVDIVNFALFKGFSELSQKRTQKALEVLSGVPSDATKLPVTLAKVYLHQENKDWHAAKSTLEKLTDPELKGLVAYKRAMIDLNSEREGALIAAKSGLTSLFVETNYQADIALHLSRMAVAQNNSKDGFGYAELALSLGGEKRRYRYQRIEVERAFGSTEKAIEMSLATIQQYPKSRSMLRQLAKSLADAGRVSEAIVRYQQLTKNNSRRSDLKALATLFHDSQQLEASAQVLERLLAKYSHDTDARYMFAENLCARGYKAECEAQVQRVLRLDHQHRRARALSIELASTQQHG